jgi:hypothetical protein
MVKQFFKKKFKINAEELMNKLSSKEKGIIYEGLNITKNSIIGNKTKKNNFIKNGIMEK